MYPLAVLDSSVIVSGIGWRSGESRQVLRLLAARGFASARTSELTSEWVEVVMRVAAEERRWRNPNYIGWLDWIKRASRLVESAKVGQTVRRDPKDDMVLAAALGGHASYIVTKDPDLLDLEKPFGIECITPRAFLSVVLRSG